MRGADLVAPLLLARHFPRLGIWVPRCPVRLCRSAFQHSHTRTGHNQPPIKQCDATVCVRWCTIPSAPAEASDPLAQEGPEWGGLCLVSLPSGSYGMDVRCVSGSSVPVVNVGKVSHRHVDNVGGALRHRLGCRYTWSIRHWRVDRGRIVHLNARHWHDCVTLVICLSTALQQGGILCLSLTSPSDLTTHHNRLAVP